MFVLANRSTAQGGRRRAMWCRDAAQPVVVPTSSVATRARLVGLAGSCTRLPLYAARASADGREVNRVKKTIIHTDPLDKDKQSRSSYPGEIVILEE